MNRGRLTVEEAAEAVVAARRALTAATQRANTAAQVFRERRTPADRIRAERAEHDYQFAADAHRLAVDRLREALQAATRVTEVDLRQVIRGFNLKARQDRACR
jgi:hypothetical protein